MLSKNDKKMIATTVIAIILFIGIRLVPVIARSNIETPNYRTIYGNVIDNNIIITDDGNEWIYTNDFNSNIKVKVVYDTLNTDDVTDDVIVRIYKCK